GTDHGHASALFVAGGPVKGGKVYGKWPGLAQEQLYEGRDLALTTDFRLAFSEVAVRHMGAASASKIFPGFTANPSDFRGFIRTSAFLLVSTQLRAEELPRKPSAQLPTCRTEQAKA